MRNLILICLAFVMLFGFAAAAHAWIIIPPPPPPADADQDGVEDDVDLCLDSELSSVDLNPNHHIWMGGEYFTTKDSKTKDLVDSEYSIQETQGCTCAQILEQKPGNNNGEEKHGCTKGTIENFIE